MQSDKEKFKKEFINRLIQFSIRVIKFGDRELSKYYSIKDQLIRSTTSIGANVVEAKSASSLRDYIKFFEIALKSANETKYWLIIAGELSTNKEEAKLLLKETCEIANILAASLLTLKGKK